jgi:hypothetical protein
VIERSGRLDDGPVEGDERRSRGQKDVRVRKQRQHEDGAGQAVDGGQLLDTEGREEVRELAPGAKRRDEGEGADVARDHQRERRGDCPEPFEREVGLDREQGQWHADEHRHRGDGRDQDERVDRHGRRRLAHDELDQSAGRHLAGLDEHPGDRREQE